MTSSITPTTEWQALKEAAHIASSLCQKLADLHIPKSQFSLPPDVDTLIPQLTLSVPTDTLAPLQTLDIPHHIRQSVYNRIQSLIGELQREYRRSYKNSCLETLRRTNSFDDVALLHRTYHALMERKCLPMIQSQVTFVVSEVAKYQPITENKRSFNNDFSPVLEKYFEFNAYPSAAHRSVLAQRSDMNPRQIEVWFQNHRNRAKKERIPVPRLNSDFPLRKALDVFRPDLHGHRARLPTPPHETQTDATKEEKRKLITSPKSKPGTFLDSSYPSRPNHAYPANRSSQSQHADPFPTENGIFKFPPLTWRRKPATASIVSVDVDMDDFCQTFHLKLNFSEVSRRRGTTPLNQEEATQPWYSSTTTFSPPAPHPAFVSTTPMSSSSSFVSSALYHASTSWPTFGSTSMSVAPIVNAPRRKMKQLPRRLPQSRSKSFGSRTWSFGSDTSSTSRKSSSSNYSSPEPITPPALPHTDLPEVRNDAKQPDLFDFSHTGLDGNDSLSRFLRSQDFDLGSSYPIDKFPDMSFFDNPLSNFDHNLGQIYP